MEWVRGHELGRGNFATINLAKITKGFDQFPPLMAVKSSVSVSSVSLKNEKEILDRIGSCPQIVTCFGDGFSVERGGEKYYNLFLEYANGGSLADAVKTHAGCGLPEFDVQRYTRGILCGLRHVHGSGFVHCDLKLSNVLLFGNGDVKIADFGLAKVAAATAAEAEKTEEKFEWRGTPMYMSPETVNGGEYEPPCDVWALGCAVLEMVAGKTAWRVRPETDIFGLMMRIGVGDEVPELPDNLSAEGKDFLQRCFVKDPRKRWTAEMLLNHPFVAGVDDTVTLKESEPTTESPTGPFDFPEFNCSDQFADQLKFDSSNSWPEMMSRLRRLMTEKPLDWSVMDSWVTVR